MMRDERAVAAPKHAQRARERDAKVHGQKREHRHPNEHGVVALCVGLLQSKIGVNRGDYPRVPGPTVRSGAGFSTQSRAAHPVLALSRPSACHGWQMLLRHHVRGTHM